MPEDKQEELTKKIGRSASPTVLRIIVTARYSDTYKQTLTRYSLDLNNQESQLAVFDPWTGHPQSPFLSFPYSRDIEQPSSVPSSSVVTLPIISDALVLRLEK